MQICRYVVSPPGPCSAGAVWRCEDGNNTPLINRQRAPSLVSVESTTLSSPGPAAGSRLCSHILHILLFITTLSVLFKMLLCSLSSVYSIHYKKIYWRAWGISSDQVELILWSQHRLHSHVGGWFLAGAHNGNNTMTRCLMYFDGLCKQQHWSWLFVATRDIFLRTDRVTPRLGRARHLIY